MIKAKSFVTLLASSLLFFVTGVQSVFAKAQNIITDENDKKYYLNDENQLIQHFEWKGGEYVYRYEFYVEKYDEETTRYSFCNVYETKETSLDIPMESGKYRYTIRVYNYLNQMDFNTDWVYFEIIRTYQPVITAVLPTVINLDEAPDGVFIIEGYNLRPETRFTVENTTYEITSQTMTKDKNFRRVAIKINPELLDAGNYYIRAVNQGGAFDTSGTIKVTFKQARDINVSGGLAPKLFLDFNRNKGTGIYTDADSLLEFFSDDNDDLAWFQPYNLTAKVTLLPYKTARMYLGGSASLDTGFFSTQGFIPGYKYEIDKEEIYTIKSHNYNLAVNGNFVYYLRKKLPFRSLIDVHGGIGVFGLAGGHIDFAASSSKKGGYKERFWSISPSVNAGAAFQTYFSDELFVEAGADIVYTLTFEKPVMNTVFIKPNLSIGWKF